jgi:hypothetical protein
MKGKEFRDFGIFFSSLIVELVHFKCIKVRLGICLFHKIKSEEYAV